MAFRSWNHGLAAVAAFDANSLVLEGAGAYGLWIYNGQRWFPDPTFPGSKTCGGDTVLWAGKLDYWLVGDLVGTGGDVTEDWPPLCRFDGVNYEWEKLPVPAATLAEVPQSSPGVPEHGGINAGACLAWNDCWFFGTYGTVVHWDGTRLSNASVGLGSSPWLQADYTAAAVQTDEAGNPFGFAVAASSTGAYVVAGTTSPLDAHAVPAQPDGAPPPQLFASFGGAFAPLGFTPPTSPLPNDPFRTDLVAVGFNPAGDGWVAGNPRYSVQPGAGQPPEPASLAPITTGGTETCSPTEFSDSSSGYYLWSSIGVFPAGDALAGGKVLWDPATSTTEPVLVDASCNGAPVITRFRELDPTAPSPASAPLIPADEDARVTSVAVNAVNDAWTATSPGTIQNATGNATYDNQPPHLYRWTDGQTPLAPAGNDYEPRPLAQSIDPIQYVVSPPVVVTEPPPPTTETTVMKSTTKTVKLKSPIYAVKSKLLAARNGTSTLLITFKVRAQVTIGAEGLLHGKVVSNTGLRRFRAGTTGELRLTLNTKAWPKQIKFYLPKTTEAKA